MRMFGLFTPPKELNTLFTSIQLSIQRQLGLPGLASFIVLITPLIPNVFGIRGELFKKYSAQNLLIVPEERPFVSSQSCDKISYFLYRKIFFPPCL